MKKSPRNLSLDITQLVHSVVRFTGREPDGFAAAVLEDGSIQVRGPHGAAFYPQQAWLSKFTRHLHRGFFDVAPVAIAAA
ncbi:MAG TPA: hypothetical protein VEA40_00655 [Ramlibacter sp.]|nr:hypothetical protein [Ramlibacter sp.]